MSRRSSRCTQIIDILQEYRQSLSLSATNARIIAVVENEWYLTEDEVADGCVEEQGDDVKESCHCL